MNVVALLGRLVADPELRQTPQGTAVTRMRIAVNRAYVKQGEERKADFIDVVAWRGTAEFVSKYFRKGSMIGVSGSIQTRTYTDKDGNNRYAFEVVADNVSFAESRGASSNQGMSMSAPPAPINNESAYSAGSNDDFTIVDDSEDLPF